MQSDDTRWVGDMREEEIMKIVCYNSYTEEKSKKEKTVFHHTREKCCTIFPAFLYFIFL